MVWKQPFNPFEDDEVTKTKVPANPITDEEKVLDIQDFLRDKSERNYILFTLGVVTGYRAGDLVKLRVRDIKDALFYKEFRIMEEKKKKTKKIRKANRKPRVVPVPQKLDKLLRKYIKDKKDYEYIFPSRKGQNKPITVGQVSRILREAGDSFSLLNITAHSMRKTYAYVLYINNDCGIDLVKEALGHSSREITKRYIGLDKESLRKASEPLNNFIRL